MAFTVADFHDLIRLLEEHPEWQAELRSHVLSKEMLAVPELMRSLLEAQARTDSSLAALGAAQVRTQEHLNTLTARVDALVAQVEKLTERVGVQGNRLDDVVGQLLELRYERRAGAYFSPLARRIRVIDPSTLADRLDDAVEQGRLSEAERRDVLRADLVFSGQRREDREEVYFLAEVSVGIGVDDVRRAADRAGMLGKLGRPVVPIVAGERIDPEPAELAGALDVWQVYDGQIRPPRAAEGRA